MLHPNEPTNYTRMLLTMMVAGMIILGWQVFIEGPRKEKFLAQQAQKQKLEASIRREQQAEQARRTPIAEPENLSRDERIARSGRVQFVTDKLRGSIALRGARLDDLRLPQYRVTQAEDSPSVILFSPSGDERGYFAQVGWISSDKSQKMPDHNSVWTANKQQFGAGEPVTLSWDNGTGLEFNLTIQLDKNYMFSIRQRVKNLTGAPVDVTPYAYINRAYDDAWAVANYAILHEGPLGVMEGSLEEISYSDVKEKAQRFKNANGWFGITDKYWLSAFIPDDNNFTVEFNHYKRSQQDRYQINYMGSSEQLDSGMQTEANFRLFAGAKEITLIDAYAEGDSKHPPIQLFDRSVDFGVLYFLTKPMFLMLHFFYELIGNFGVAILLLTIVVKLIMFPLANKAYKSAAQMRTLQPKMQELNERYKDDPMKKQQEMIAMYKREKVNPAAGCLPVLIQMPVFFALYKVLFVTIEMRHAPFFGWITDLSAIDPSNIFTLFGVLDWSHPDWMHLGILPILMCLTMVIQMKQQPKPADPVQAKIIGWMPYFFLIIFATFPAGLVLYWVWNNILSIIQQHFISLKYGKPPKTIGKAK